MSGDLFAAAAAAPLITAVVAAVGMAAPAIPRRLYPLLAISFGIAWAALVASSQDRLGWSVILEGIIAGLTASGLYSAAVKPIGDLARSDG